MILHHVSVGVSDVAAAVAFYDAVLAPLSIQRTHYVENMTAAYGKQFEFWIGRPCEGKASSGNGTHICFSAPDRDAVNTFYRTAIDQGGTCAGQPGLRPEHGDTYYAAFIQDPDGNKIEAVIMS